MGLPAMTGYAKFVQQIDEVISKYPKLTKQEHKGVSYIGGEMDIVDNDGQFWETYMIEIHYKKGYPFRYPSLYEVGGKIPRIADWHIYEDTGSCCVKVLPEEIIRCKTGITLLQYVEEEVLPYLFNQTHRRVEGYYVNGEYSHGLLGIFEFYSQILNTENDIKETIRLLYLAAENDKLGRTESCFCGKSIKFRKCHRGAHIKLMSIGKDIIKSDAIRFARAAGLT